MGGAMALKIVSGGQTGVDRAALDAALARGCPCGGWCPRGRRAEDGRIPARYPLQELEDPDYSSRTRRNVLDSDATLIVYFGGLEGGTALTRVCCRELGRPCLLTDGCATQEWQAAASRVLDFVGARRIQVLNVAGPRASKEPRAYPYAYQLMAQVLSGC